MEYTIIQERVTEKFIAMVNKAIKEGWKPQGGVVINQYLYFYQAMVREVKPSS